MKILLIKEARTFILTNEYPPFRISEGGQTNIQPELSSPDNYRDESTACPELVLGNTFKNKIIKVSNPDFFSE